jgi:repressor LexA
MNEDQEKLGKLQDYYAKYKALPSYSYMGDKFNFGSKESVFRFVAKLKKELFLDVAPDSKLIPGKRFFERRKSLSTVQAGEFTNDHVEEHDFISIDAIVIEKPSITELMDVEGPSMIEKGIFDGDTAIVQVRKDAKVGDIVVAIIEGGKKTIKTLGKEGDDYVLIPANKEFHTLRPENGFEIYGVLDWTFRKHN